MTKQDSRCPACGAPANADRQKGPVAPADVHEKDDDRETGAPDERSPVGWEYDHRGVRMPRRARIGGIIIPQ